MEIISPRYDHRRCKSPVFSVPIHGDFAPHVGQCILLWSHIDRSINSLLNAMVRAAGAEQPHPSFDKRIAEFLRLVKTCFPDNPNVAALLTDLGVDIRNAVVDRHLLAHGHISFSMAGHGRLEARGRYKGKEVTRSYTLPQMEQLFYDLSHISGRLFFLGAPELIKPDEKQWPRLSSPDITLLRSFFGTSPVSSPIPR